MPRKNIVKVYVENGYYHVYNRGVDKREIFMEEEECRVFLYFLKVYLSDPEILQSQMKELSPRLRMKLLNKNLFHEIKLLSFSLMPNHFHLQIKQVTKDGMEKFMKRLIPSYVQYFNTKHKRIGPLFESIYKAVFITTDEQNLYLSSYIHRNAMKLKNPKFDFIQFSSYPYYLGAKQADWLSSQEILAFFKQEKGRDDLLSYQNFVESFRENPEEILEELTLEDD